MAEQISPPHVFDLHEVLVALIRQKGIHEGIWSLGVEFGFGAAVFSPKNDTMFPTAFAQVHKIGLTRAEVEGPLAVDASKVNPAVKRVKKRPVLKASTKDTSKPVRKPASEKK